MNFIKIFNILSYLVLIIHFKISADCEYCNCINCCEISTESLKEELLYNAQDMQKYLENSLIQKENHDKIIDLAIKYIANCQQISQKADENDAKNR